MSAALISGEITQSYVHGERAESETFVERGRGAEDWRGAQEMETGEVAMEERRAEKHL